MKATKPTADEVRKAFTYNAQTGQLIWNHFPGCRTAGKIAGTVNAYGFVMVGLNRKIYPAHCFVWVLHFGEWPKYPLRHRNGDRADMHVNNLVEMVPRHLPKPIRKMKGAQYCGTHFRARITKPDGTLAHIGNFPTQEEARNAYHAKHVELYGTKSPHFVGSE